MIDVECSYRGFSSSGRRRSSLDGHGRGRSSQPTMTAFVAVAVLAESSCEAYSSACYSGSTSTLLMRDL